MTEKEIDLGVLDECNVQFIHDKMLEKYGGLPGIRDENALCSALNKPRMRLCYGADCDLFEAAASAGYGVIKNHPFNDANKRTGTVLVLSLLRSNGYDVTKDVSHEKLIELFLNVASGNMEEKELASFLRDNSRAISSKKVLEDTAFLRQAVFKGLASR